MIILEITPRKIPKSSGEEVVVKRNVRCETVDLKRCHENITSAEITWCYGPFRKSWARLLAPSSTHIFNPYHHDCLENCVHVSRPAFIFNYWFRTPFWRSGTTNLPKLLPGPFAHLWKRRSGSLLRSADWPPRDTKSGRMDSVDYTCVCCVSLCEVLAYCHQQTTIQEDAQKK